MPLALIPENTDIAQREGEIALLTAVALGDEESARSLLTWVKRVNARHSKPGDTPLITATRHGRVEIARLLLATGRADPHARSGPGHSECAISIAALLGHEELFEALAPFYDSDAPVSSESAQPEGLRASWADESCPQEAPIELNALFHAAANAASEKIFEIAATPERAAARDAFGRTPLIVFCGRESMAPLPSPRTARALIAASDPDARTRGDVGDLQGRKVVGIERAFTDRSALDAAIDAKNWPMARALWPLSSLETRKIAVLALLARFERWPARHPGGNPIDRLLGDCSRDDFSQIMTVLLPAIDAFNANGSMRFTTQGSWSLAERAPLSHARWTAETESRTLGEATAAKPGDNNAKATPRAPAARL